MRDQLVIFVNIDLLCAVTTALVAVYRIAQDVFLATHCSLNNLLESASSTAAGVQHLNAFVRAV